MFIFSLVDLYSLKPGQKFVCGLLLENKVQQTIKAFFVLFNKLLSEVKYIDNGAFCGPYCARNVNKIT